MSPRAPVTQRDIARACGVHPSTICLALKNSPAITSETRTRIQAIAEELGYRPNVAARNLALLRSDRPHGVNLPIAWINQEPTRGHWRNDPESRGHFESASRRARELGYYVEEIWASEPGMSVVRLIEIIQTRGIEGVILPVHHRFNPALLTPAWSEFALMGLNDYRLADWVDTVCPDHTRNLSTLCRQLRQLGAMRAGLVLSPELDAASHGLIQNSFLRTQHELGMVDRHAVLVLPTNERDRLPALRAWLTSYRPLGVICTDAKLVTPARGFAPDVTWLGLTSASAPFDGGLDAGNSELGAQAVDDLVGKLRRFETGLRPAPRLHLLKSAWVEPARPALALAAAGG